MESYVVFKDLAIIIIAAKFFGILARKCKAPQVVGGDYCRAYYWSQHLRVSKPIGFSD